MSHPAADRRERPRRPRRVEGKGWAFVLAVAVARARMDAWRSRLAEHGVHADHLLSEGLLLAHDAGPVLLLDEGRATLRHARGGLLAGAAEEVPSWLELLAEGGAAAPL